MSVINDLQKAAGNVKGAIKDGADKLADKAHNSF